MNQLAKLRREIHGLHEFIELSGPEILKAATQEERQRLIENGTWCLAGTS